MASFEDRPFIPKRGPLKAFVSAILLTGLLLAPPVAHSNNTIHVASFNVHYIVPHDKKEDWDERQHAIRNVLKEMNADIIAFQEMETFDGGDYSERNLQLEWVLSTTAGYAPAAIGDPAIIPTTQPVLYKTAKFTVIDQGFFFFSETPDSIYSAQWNGGYPYFCTWVRFRRMEATSDFYVFNLHNDFRSRRNRLKTSELVATRIQQIVQNDLPVIVLGDFNALASFKEIRLLEEIGLGVLPPGGATNRVLGLHLLPAIDHILLSRSIQPQSETRVWRNKYDGVYPADHYPISVEVTFH